KVMREWSRSLPAQLAVAEQPSVSLVDYDPDGEAKVLAAALYSVSDYPETVLLDLVRNMGVEDRQNLLRTYVGDRRNRRHKPGRAFERTHYRFDILADYAAFRDLQRHRLLTVEWQSLTTAHGYMVPEAVAEVGALGDWQANMDSASSLFES